MKDLLVDFSALSTLYCERRYQFTCVEGIDSSTKETDWGGAFHHFLEARGKGNTGTLMEVTKDLLPGLEPDAGSQLLLVAAVWDRTQVIPPAVLDASGVPVVEWKFHFPIMTVEDYRIILCGTIDHLTLESGTLHLTDYKTTARTSGLDKHYESHLLSFQAIFYMWVLHKYLAHLFPPDIAQLLRNLRIYATYKFILRSFAPPKFESSSPISLAAENIPTYEELLLGLIQKAIKVHKRTTLAPPEGMAFVQCTNCPYKGLCLMQDQTRILQVLSTLPHRIYDPTNFR